MKLQDDPETLPPDLEEVRWPPAFVNIKRKIQVEQDVAITHSDFPMSPGQRLVVEGFEDILQGEVLGQGHLYNTPHTTGQLFYALALANHPFLRDIQPNLTPRKIIEQLRALQVLQGMKIMDLGCGKKPAFALAATALGATVWTVDFINLYPSIHFERHIILDLCQEDAAGQLLQKTGGNFDLVTEGILTLVPGMRGLKKPDQPTIARIASTLLKRGGYFFNADLDSLLNGTAHQKK